MKPLRLLALGAALLLLPGCVTTTTWLDARDRLNSAIATGQKWAQQGATAVCMNYSQMAAVFDTVAVTGVVNDATVRDVRVTASILDTTCPDILSGRAKNTAAAAQIVMTTYRMLMQAAAEARRQHAAAKPTGV